MNWAEEYAKRQTHLPAGWVARCEKKEDGIDDKYYLNLGTGIKVYSVEAMFSYTDNQSAQAGPSEEPGLDHREHAIYFSPSFWGVKEEVLTQRCNCGKVGELACFSGGFRRWYLTGGPKKVSEQYCTRCKELGHDTFCCPLPVIPRWNRFSTSKPFVVRSHGPTLIQTPRLGERNLIAQGPTVFQKPHIGERSLSARVTVVKTRKPPRCSRCGKTGHNCRSCRKAI